MSEEIQVCSICVRPLYKNENPDYCERCLEFFENPEFNLLLDEDYLPLRWIRVTGEVSDKYLIMTEDYIVSKYVQKPTMKV